MIAECRRKTGSGPKGRASCTALKVLDAGRVEIAACAVGVFAEAALVAAVSWARQRRVGGKPIGDFQGIQWMLADMAQKSKPRASLGSPQPASANSASASPATHPWRSCSRRRWSPVSPIKPFRSTADMALRAGSRLNDMPEIVGFFGSTRARRRSSGTLSRAVSWIEYQPQTRRALRVRS